MSADTPAPTELAERWAASEHTMAVLSGQPRPVVWVGGPSGHDCEPRDGLTRTEREQLFAWLRARADEYRQLDLLHGLDSYADWLGMDLGGRFEDDRDLTMALLTAAGVRP